MATLASRIIARHGRSISQVIIQWLGLSPKATTWEDVDVIKSQPLRTRFCLMGDQVLQTKV